MRKRILTFFTVYGGALVGMALVFAFVGSLCYVYVMMSRPPEIMGEPYPQAIAQNAHPP